MTFALVPAAGLSSRMGRPKLLLPLGGRTLLEHVVSTLLQGGVETVLVIVGPQSPEIAQAAQTAGGAVLSLPEPTPAMRQSVERGLCWAEEYRHPAPADRWLLAPADHPGFSPETVRRLLEVPDLAVVLPTHAGRRGHPVRFRWQHVAGIRSLPPDLGIDAFVRSAVVKSLELPVDDPGILSNVNRPEDYDRLLATRSTS